VEKLIVGAFDAQVAEITNDKHVLIRHLYFVEIGLLYVLLWLFQT